MALLLKSLSPTAGAASHRQGIDRRRVQGGVPPRGLYTVLCAIL